MPKYTEAFFNITHKPVTIMQIRNEYNLDHTVYERRYKGHIFCPYCKAVPLTQDQPVFPFELSFSVTLLMQNIMFFFVS